MQIDRSENSALKNITHNVPSEFESYIMHHLSCIYNLSFSFYYFLDRSELIVYENY